VNRSIKRLCDVLAALVGLIVLVPLLIAIAIAIYMSMGRPILFTQPRPGKNGRLFTFYKFRTMGHAYDANGEFIPDDQRLTPLGRFLRKTSLDELPQLWNILTGDMSFVGPRPLLAEYLDYYTPEQARRHQVKPGITGWAQVNGRQNIPFSRRLQLDVYYVEHWSLYFDFKILLLTIVKVLGMSDIKLGQAVQEVDDIGLSRKIVPLPDCPNDRA
jgi:sugar transferase EpsL